MRRDCYNDGENPTLGPAPTGASPRSERLGHPGPRRWPHLRPRAGPLAHLPLGDLRQAQGFKQRVSSRDPHIRSAPAAGPVAQGCLAGTAPRRAPAPPRGCVGSSPACSCHHPGGTLAPLLPELHVSAHSASRHARLAALSRSPSAPPRCGPSPLSWTGAASLLPPPTQSPEERDGNGSRPCRSSSSSHLTRRESKDLPVVSGARHQQAPSALGLLHPITLP